MVRQDKGIIKKHNVSFINQVQSEVAKEEVLEQIDTLKSKKSLRLDGIHLRVQK